MRRSVRISQGMPHSTGFFSFNYNSIDESFTFLCCFSQVCVASCPDDTFVATALAQTLGERQTKAKMICKDNVTRDQYSVTDLVKNGDCAAWYIKSSPGKRIFPYNISCFCYKETRLCLARPPLDNIYINQPYVCVCINSCWEMLANIEQHSQFQGYASQIPAALWQRF